MKDFFRERKNEFEFGFNGNPNFPPHIHEDIEIIYVTQGEGYAFCDDETYKLEKGDFFLVFPNQIHYYNDFPQGSTSVLITAKPEIFSSFTDIFDGSVPLSARYKSNESDQNMMKILEIIFNEYYINGSKNTIILLLSAFLGMLLERYEISNTNSNNSCASKILNYCKKHYKEELTIDILSEKLHISRSHISHTLNNRLKISFPDYINSLRLSKAVKLLNKNDLSITEVAQQSGFQTIRNFNRIFKKQFKVSPKIYVKGKSENYKTIE